MSQEHETALRFFQRALQLDPTFAYAYTLAGHEYFANEDFDNGMKCFRNAMRIDPRHYNAWCAQSTSRSLGQMHTWEQAFPIQQLGQPMPCRQLRCN